MQKLSFLHLSKTVLFSTTSIILTLSMSSAMESSQSRLLSSESQNANDVRIMSVDEFQKAIDANEFLNQHALSGPLNDGELYNISLAHQWATKSVGGKILRDIKDFKGDILVVGAGKKERGRGKFVGITDSEKLKSDLERKRNFLKWLGTEEAKQNFSDEKWTIEAKEEIKHLEETIKGLGEESINEENQKILDTFYSVNIEPETEPDLIASITSLSDTSSLPDQRFSKVIFENVDSIVFLNPNTMKIIERISKPGGVIEISAGKGAARLFIDAFSKTRWANDVNQQYLDQVDSEIFKKGRMIFTLKN